MGDTQYIAKLTEIGKEAFLRWDINEDIADLSIYHIVKRVLLKINREKDDEQAYQAYIELSTLKILNQIRN